MKRSRSDSAASAVKAMLNAAKPKLMPPAHILLRPEDLPFWDAIMLARSTDEWIENDLILAAQLARCQFDAEMEAALLAQEGSVLTAPTGKVLANPRATILEKLINREMALMRTLRMGGRIAGDARNSSGSRMIERKAREIRAEMHDDELLA